MQDWMLDVDAHMFELGKYSDALATWVEQNEPEHWPCQNSQRKDGIK